MAVVGLKCVGAARYATVVLHHVFRGMGIEEVVGGAPCAEEVIVFMIIQQTTLNFDTIGGFHAGVKIKCILIEISALPWLVFGGVPDPNSESLVFLSRYARRSDRWSMVNAMFEK